jgi:hypothetical protein
VRERFSDSGCDRGPRYFPPHHQDGLRREFLFLDGIRDIFFRPRFFTYAIKTNARADFFHQPGVASGLRCVDFVYKSRARGRTLGVIPKRRRNTRQKIS